MEHTNPESTFLGEFGLFTAFIEDFVAEEMANAKLSTKDLPKLIEKLEKDMHKAAKLLDFEQAAQIRDKLKELRLLASEKKDD